MKVSDCAARILAENGVSDVFLVAGGGIMHMMDSVGRHPGLTYHTTYHEQAAVVAAEGYARCTGRPALVLVTVGPGAANAASGLPGAWIDSLPILVIAGNLRQDLLADYGQLRQYGPQEANTLDMVKPFTKYAARVREPKQIRAELERALHAAVTGRPGPAWLELPLDVQGAEVDERDLALFTPPARTPAPSSLESSVASVLDHVRRADRPLIIPGNGIHAASAERQLSAVLERLPIPVAIPLTAKDVVPENHPRYIGVFGTAGQRRANFAVQNSDCIVTIGAGLNVQKVGFNFAGFAPKATKIIVDVDEQQLRNQAVKPDVPILADARAFLEELLRQIEEKPVVPHQRWLDACARWRERYPLITPDYFEGADHVNSYVFVDRLSDVVRASDTIVPGAGLDTASCYQAYRVKPGQRVLISAWGALGWELPLAIGACKGMGIRRTIVVTGDGSIQWNLQELMTISRFRLPIKIFVFNNGGFASILGTQKNFFNGNFVGAHHESGIANPNFATLAAAYGLAYAHIGNNAELDSGLPAFLADDEPSLCELNVAPEQPVSPKASAFRRDDGTFESRPLEDMAPFLPREEIYENMHLFDEEPASR